MSSTEAQQARSRYGWLSRHRGPDHPDTIAAREELRRRRLSAAVLDFEVGRLSEAEFAGLVEDLGALYARERMGYPPGRPSARVLRW